MNPEDTIYKAFHTSRERYTRIINTGVVRYGKGELDSLSQITGIRKEIFLGEVHFSCPYELEKQDTAGKKSIEKGEITDEDWKRLFQWRKVRSGAKGTSLLPTVLIMLENRFQRFPVRRNAQDWLGC